MKIKMLLICVGMQLCLHAQLKTITGQVTSTVTGDPLAGATLHLMATSSSSITNNTGYFKMVVTTLPDTITVSSTGYIPIRIPVTSNKLYYVISLQPNSYEMENLTVNTGYQQLPKERTTGSFSIVNNTRYNEQVGTNVLSRLETIVNGLTVNRRTNSTDQVSIRGLSSIRGPRDPLIILDNFPYQGDINNINPNDVESITVLKDATAASIWGAKAGNGVIVITTKKGKFNQRTTVSFNSNITIVRKPDLFYLQPISSSDFIDVEKTLFNNQYRFSDTANDYHPPFSPVYEILFKQRNGIISETEATREINLLKTHDVRNDFLRCLYRQGINQQYAVNASGGGQNMSWYLSGGYDDNIGNSYETFKRISLKSEQLYAPLKNLKMRLGVFYSQSRQQEGRPAYGSITNAMGNIPPYTKFVDEAGNYLSLSKDLREGYTDTAGGGKLLSWKYFPAEDYKHTNNHTTNQDLSLEGGLQYQMFKSLMLDIKYRYETQATLTSNLQDEQSYYARDLVNRFTQIGSDGSLVYIIPKGGILDLRDRKLTAQNIRVQLNFTKDFSGRHYIAALAGFETNEVLVKQVTSRSYGFDPNVLTSNNVDLTHAYPTYITGSYELIPGGGIGFLSTNNRFVSMFMNASYSYLSRYTFNASARRDASNLYGINTNNKWKPLWSAGFKWDISREPFYKSESIPYLAFRTTYGISGNTDPGRSGVTVLSYGFPSPYTQTQTASITNFGNPELKWEQIAMTNFGLDFRLNNSRLSGNLEYYFKKGTNLLGNAPVDYTAGLGVRSITKNVASIKGNGIDILLESLNLNRKLKWTTQLIFNYYKDKIVHYYLSSNAGSNFVYGAQMVAGVEGKPVYSIFSYRWAGLDPQNGDPRGYNADTISKDYYLIIGNGTTINDLKYHGSALPLISGAIGNTFSYKNWQLTARVAYRFRYYYQRKSIYYSALYPNGDGHADYALRWKTPGDELHTNVPSAIYPANFARDAFYNGSEVLVEKGDNIRLQYVNLSYNLFDQGSKKTPFKNLTISLIANNLGILWKASKDNTDPDYMVGSLPAPKSFSIAFHLNF